MGHITLQVLDGTDRGKTYRNLLAPVTIGREEGNAVQLNDERVSRYHAKIQEDQGQLVLTDLESTNGTRVNGQNIQLSILRVGDRIAVGRSLLLLGSSEEIEQDLEQTPSSPHASLDEKTQAGTALPGELSHDPARAEELRFELNFDHHPPSYTDGSSLSASSTTFAPARSRPPDLPARLTPAQAAQLAELLLYLHQQLARATADVVQNQDDPNVELAVAAWQRILRVEMELARFIYNVGRPEP